MANEEHLAILRQGVEIWNAWRQENPCIEPDLSGAHLEWTKLFRIDLSDTIMNDVILVSAQLDVANFSRAQLIGQNSQVQAWREPSSRRSILQKRILKALSYGAQISVRRA